MAWSTRQLAELAGTTVKAVRHYHRLGLLELPERAANGYKQYGTAHLVRLLQIRRMTALGVPLAQIGALGETDRDPSEAIRVLDADLEATIARLQRAREELALLLEHQAPLDTPPPFEAVSDGLLDRYRSLLTVYSGVLSDDALDDVRALMLEPDEASEPFEALTAESDDVAVEQVAALLAETMAEHRERFPWMAEPGSGSRRGSRLLEEALAPAIAEVFNAGQVRALARAAELAAQGRAGSEPER